jgi:hypothetical protein
VGSGQWIVLSSKDSAPRRGGRKGTPPGNSYEYDYKGLAKKATRKVMKIRDFQIDQPGGAICKFMKTKEAQK